MKAEAPEKLYFRRNGFRYLAIYSNKEYDDEVEYVRADVFIKKAVEWLKSNLYDYAGEDDMGSIVPFDSSIFEDFKNYMKGE